MDTYFRFIQRMLDIHIATIFPKYFNGPFSETIIKRAIKKNMLKITVHDLRDFVSNKHRQVDDTPYGGGPGMILMIEPFDKLLSYIFTHNPKTPHDKVILTSPKGRLFEQNIASEYSTLSRLIILCGRYEGVDHRVSQYLIDQEISVGNFVLSGGEPAAITIVDSVSRLIPGVLGNPESLATETFNNGNGNSQTDKDFYKEYPQYTKPEIYKSVTGNEWKVPEVLVSGNHEEIKKWRGC